MTIRRILTTRTIRPPKPRGKITVTFTTQKPNGSIVRTTKTKHF